MTQKTQGTARLDERSRIIVPQEVKDILKLAPAIGKNEEGGPTKGDLVNFILDEKAKRVYIEKAP